MRRHLARRNRNFRNKVLRERNVEGTPAPWADFQKIARPEILHSDDFAKSVAVLINNGETIEIRVIVFVLVRLRQLVPVSSLRRVWALNGSALQLPFD